MKKLTWKLTRRSAEKFSSGPKKEFQMKFNFFWSGFRFGKNVRARTFQHHLALEYLDR